MSCPNCGREHKRSKNGPCANCYRKIYTSTPIGKKARNEANKTWVRRNGSKRWQHIIRYRTRTGYYVPGDVLALRRALKRLEANLATATQRQGASITQVNAVATMVLNGDIPLKRARIYSALTRVLAQNVSAEITKARFGKNLPDLTFDEDVLKEP